MRPFFRFWSQVVWNLRVTVGLTGQFTANIRPLTPAPITRAQLMFTPAIRMGAQCTVATLTTAITIGIGAIIGIAVVMGIAIGMTGTTGTRFLFARQRVQGVLRRRENS